MFTSHQNKNVHRISTSEQIVFDLRRPDRRTPMKVLVKKTFNFVDQIWKTYTQQIISDVGFVYVHVNVLYVIYVVCNGKKY